MTKEAGFIALKKDSEARSIIAQLGLCKELKGTHIIKNLIMGNRSTEKLTDLEVKQVLASWETRHCVPIKLIDPKESIQIKIDNFQLTKENDETEIEYKRRKVKLIEKYVKTILA